MTATAEDPVAQLYTDMTREHLDPLWTQVDNLMPITPSPKAVPHVWKWDRLLPIAQRSGRLVPVGRGGERRAIALANPGLGGLPHATATLWAAIQYLGAKETAPEHRHSQSAFRFVVEGQGVWTVVDGDPVAMCRGDLLVTPGWSFHGHQNISEEPMAWIDGLDIPLVGYTDTGFFEFGTDGLSDESVPDRSRSERLWAYPGLRPLVGLAARANTPIAAYRWAHTDAALHNQLELEAEGRPATIEPGHAGVRYANPTTGGDILPTIRVEFHRLRAGTQTRTRREVGSTVYQVFDGRGNVVLDGRPAEVGRGDVVAVPSWTRWSIHAEAQLDLFAFSDAPVIEAMRLNRTEFVDED